MSDQLLTSTDDSLRLAKFRSTIQIYDLSELVDHIISEDCCYAIAQSYEVFETFYCDALAEYLLQNPAEIQAAKIFKDIPFKFNFANIRDALHKSKSRNNKGLLSVTRRLSDHFKQSESDNLLSHSVSRWFDLLSEVRHVLVHNRQIVTTKFRSYLEVGEQEELFNTYFLRKEYKGKEYVFMNRLSATRVFQIVSSFAFMIFKSLSKERELDTDVPSFDHHTFQPV